MASMLSSMSYSWETQSAATSAPAASAGAFAENTERVRLRLRALAARVPRPELLAVMALAGVLNLWSLSRNGWANEYYAAAVRSMSASWHDFLFASLDRGGVMTVDKPPLALWIESLSVRVFGYHSLSILVPEALMGIASVALVYDLVRRRFGRVGGFVAGLTLAVTPITVAISRHNNPDSLLILCCVGALWCTVRAFDAAPARSGTRWLVAAGVLVGLGFETKMLVALVIVPGIVLAWLWVAPAGRGRLHALRQLLGGGGAMLLVGGAWPLLVELTPAADRPWISGTSNNTILSLVFEYNGVGRVDGQAGGPGGAGGGNVFGGSTGPLRLLNSALGGQAGWLLGFALVSGLGILVASRLRRTDARSGWLLAVGGAFATTAVLFSAASGIFHPYYVSLLAPFAAALVGAGAAQLIGGGVNTRMVGPLAVVAGVITELIVVGDYPGQLPWLEPVLIVVGLLTVIALAAFSSRTVRIAAVGAAVAALLAAPSVWAFDTLGHATSGTFPAGGPTSAETIGGGPGGGNGGGVPLFGPPGALGGPPGGGFAGGPGRGAGPGAAGGFGGGGQLTSALSYISAHGGGTLAVSSQSTAATAIIAGHTNVAGIGGFSGRESDPSVSWLAQEVRSGRIRWVLDEQSSGFGGGNAPGETRVGSKPAMAAVAKACQAVTLSGSGALYDCQGDAAALAALGTQQSHS
jgi:4-amino-4-deoxy-L-arabinose transferase-like glycosyltransferase